MGLRRRLIQGFFEDYQTDIQGFADQSILLNFCFLIKYIDAGTEFSILIKDLRLEWFFPVGFSSTQFYPHCCI